MLLIDTLHNSAIFSRLGPIIAVIEDKDAVFYFSLGRFEPGAGDEPVTNMIIMYLAAALYGPGFIHPSHTDPYVHR